MLWGKFPYFSYEVGQSGLLCRCSPPQTRLKQTQESCPNKQSAEQAREVNMRFHGEYKHSVDSKGRISLPSKFRKALPDEVVIVPSTSGALSVFSEEGFQEWVDSYFPKKEDGTGGYNPRKLDDVKLMRALNAQAESVTVDSNGRIMISAAKREKAGIGASAYVIGSGDRVEIMNVEAYEAQMEEFSLESFLV